MTIGFPTYRNGGSPDEEAFVAQHCHFLFCSDDAGCAARAGFAGIGKLAGPHRFHPAAALADPGDWPMYGHDYQRTNYNPAETTINAGNLAQLVSRWQVNVGSNGTPTSAAPSVADGVVYVGSSASSGDNFFAFDATSGSTIWHEGIGFRNPGCFNVGIGSTPAISGTQVVVGADQANSQPAYFGIDTVSGTKVWTNTMNLGASAFPWESPFIYNGRAYLGMSSRCDNPSVRGELRAVDITNGATVGAHILLALVSPVVASGTRLPYHLTAA